MKRRIEKSYFSRNLYYLRNRRGVTQEEMAGDLNLKRSTLGAWEENRNEPNHVMSYNIARYFNVSLQSMVSKSLKRK